MTLSWRAKSVHSRRLVTECSCGESPMDRNARIFIAGHRGLVGAKVGGIVANDTYPVDFLRDNLAIELNVIDSAWRHNVRKLCFLGSSCVYPKFARQPI